MIVGKCGRRKYNLAKSIFAFTLSCRQLKDVQSSRGRAQPHPHDTTATTPICYYMITGGMEYAYDMNAI